MAAHKMSPRRRHSKKRPGNPGPRPFTADDAASLQSDDDISEYGLPQAHRRSQRNRAGEISKGGQDTTRGHAGNGAKPLRNNGIGRGMRKTCFDLCEETSDDELKSVRLGKAHLPSALPYALNQQKQKKGNQIQQPRSQSLTYSRPFRELCSNCSTVRRSNRALRDILLTSLNRQLCAVEFWADNVGVGNGSTVDEMDWQHEPTTLVRLRDRRLSSMRNIVREADAGTAPTSTASPAHLYGSSAQESEHTAIDPRTGEARRQDYGSSKRDAVEQLIGGMLAGLNHPTTYAPQAALQTDMAALGDALPSILEQSPPVSRNPLMEYRGQSSDTLNSAPGLSTPTRTGLATGYQTLPSPSWASQGARRNATTGAETFGSPGGFLNQYLHYFQNSAQSPPYSYQQYRPQPQPQPSTQDLISGLKALRSGGVEPETPGETATDRDASSARRTADWGVYESR